MQNCKYLIIGCLIGLFVSKSNAQSSSEITGLWTGLMFNDSTELSYRYEIAISEKNGNLIGYSQTFFILDNQEYYGVKKIKITLEGNKVITQDLKLLKNNYPIKPPKGVYMINALNFEVKNDIMVLNGIFETNRTRVYSPVTGYVHVEKKVDLSKSPLITQLKELGLDDDLSFLPPKETLDIATTSPSKPVNRELPSKEKTVKSKTIKEKEIVDAKEIAVQQVTEIKPAVHAPAANINNRIIETIRSVNYTSDSLLITLYDNGEVDGDTVSILMNGKLVMPMIGLSTNPVRKTIYTRDFPDSIQIVMYAENLGTLPPNTGLLIVNDGKERYEIRFSGDLKKNSAIVLRRKEK